MSISEPEIKILTDAEGVTAYSMSLGGTWYPLQIDNDRFLLYNQARIRKAPSVDENIVTQSRLENSVREWAEVANIGFWSLPINKEVKEVRFTPDADAARYCMLKGHNECPSDTCEVVNKSCLPSKTDASQQSWWNVGSKLNARPSGKVFSIVWATSVQTSSEPRYITMLEPDERPESTLIVVFPGNARNGESTIIGDDKRQQCIDEIKEQLPKRERVVLCGHSTGSTWAQMVAYHLTSSLNRDEVEKVFVVGGAPLKWMDENQLRQWDYYFGKQCAFFVVYSEDNYWQGYIDSFTQRCAGPRCLRKFGDNKEELCTGDCPTRTGPLILIDMKTGKKVELNDSYKPVIASYEDLHSLSIILPLVFKFMYKYYYVPSVKK
jgi:hypothetical protein